MRKKIFIYLFVNILIIAGFFIKCGKGGNDHPAGEDEHSEETHLHEEGEHGYEKETGAHQHLHVKPEIIKRWGFQNNSPAPRDYVEKIVMTGVVKENKETTFIINALVSGIVTKINKDIGDPVKKGDTLCVLNSPELLDLKTKHIKAFQNYRLTKENYERSKRLFEIKALEKKELISRETAYKIALADYFSLEAELGTIGFDKKRLQNIKEALRQDEDEKLKEFLSPYYNVLSPAWGKVIARNLTLGERVENNVSIFEISDIRKLWVILDAKENDLQFIEKKKKLTIVSDVYPGEYFNGKVTTLMEKVDLELRTVKIRVEVDNSSGRLKPGMYVRGRIEKKLKKTHLAISSGALVKISGIDGVFVIDDDGFKFKPVQVIEIDSAGFAFIEGLHEEEMVITEGSFYLKAEYEIQSGTADPHAGHSH